MAYYLIATICLFDHTLCRQEDKNDQNLYLRYYPSPKDANVSGVIPLVRIVNCQFLPGEWDIRLRRSCAREDTVLSLGVKTCT